MKERFHLDLFAESTGLNRDGLMLAAEWWVEFDYEPADESVGMAEQIYINEIGCDGLAGDTLKAFQEWMAGQEIQIADLLYDRLEAAREERRARQEEADVEAYEARILDRMFLHESAT